jgi:hypothetical protein
MISWNTNSPNHFVVIGTDLKSFKTENNRIITKDKFELVSPVRSFAWSPKYFKEEGCIALGLSNGNLQLFDFSNHETIKEFGNNQQRACQSLAWNPIQTNYIAVGFEKSRNTSSLAIWDYNTRGDRPKKDEFQTSSKSNEYVSIPQFEFNTNFEPTTALTWIPNQHTCLFAGILKSIKLFDFRDTKKASSSFVAHGSNIKGIHFDPNDATRMISWEDGLIKVWDTRRMETIKSFKVGSNIVYENLNGMIASFEKNELKLWDLLDGKKLQYKYSNYKSITIPDGIQSISFHPTRCNEMLIYNDAIRLMQNGNFEMIAFGMDLHGPFEGKRESLEISDVMYKRAIRGFGLNIEKNITICKEMDQEREFLWTWVEKWKRIPGAENLSDVKTTKSMSVPEMSGFTTFDRPGPNQIFDWLETSCFTTTTRTFAKHVFNLCLKKAIPLLTSLDNPFYKYLAYALFKYSPDSFRELFQNEKLDDPYIRASIGFLKNNDFSSVLYESGIPFTDRMAFALKYLPNDALMNYCTKMREMFIQQGDLQGIVLTGLSHLDTLRLLTNYVDKSSDVQTAAILMTLIPIKERQAIIWLETLRDLMDKWKLWEQRAMFDMEVKASIESHSMMIKCKFCNQSISTEKKRAFRKYGGGTTIASACPNCSKPLPTCSICEMSYGSSCWSFGSDKVTNSLDYTFVWCTQCKHAGHMKHLSDWFETHTVCPVPGCECICTRD